MLVCLFAFILETQRGISFRNTSINVLYAYMCMFAHIYEMIGEHATENSLLFEICQVWRKMEI